MITYNTPAINITLVNFGIYHIAYYETLKSVCLNPPIYQDTNIKYVVLSQLKIDANITYQFLLKLNWRIRIKYAKKLHVFQKSDLSLDVSLFQTEQIQFEQ